MGWLNSSTCFEVGHRKLSTANVTAIGEKTENIPEAMHVCVKYSRAGKKHGIKAVSKLSKSLGSFLKMKIRKSHFCGSVLVNPE